jgi:hypothetical protein
MLAYRSVVKMEMGLLDAFSVVSLRIGQTEETLLQKGTGF